MTAGRSGGNTSFFFRTSLSKMRWIAFHCSEERSQKDFMAPLCPRVAGQICGSEICLFGICKEHHNDQNYILPNT